MDCIDLSLPRNPSEASDSHAASKANDPARMSEIEPANSKFELQQRFVEDVLDACRSDEGDDRAQTSGTAPS
jgi:hypothetical protein